MVSTGNTNQWTNGYPSREILTEDIERNEMYVLEMKMAFKQVLCFIVVLILVTIKYMMANG